MPERAEHLARLTRTAPPGARHSAPRRAREASAVTWVIAVTALAFVVNVSSDRQIAADGFYDLYAGRFIAAHGIPHRNVLTVASHGAPWTDQQWLAHVAYYGAWVLGGYPAVAILSALLVTSGFTVLGLAMLDRGVPPARMFGWTAAALIVCVGNTVVRAQSFAYPLFALTLFLLLADSRAQRLRARTWLVIPVLVVWANTHGSVLVGAALAAGYGCCRAVVALRHDRGAVPACLAFGACAAASVVCTPYGTGVIGFYERVDSVTPVLVHDIPEWAPPSPLSPLSWGFFAGALAVAAAVVVAWRRGGLPDPWLAAAGVLLLGLAFTAVRNQVWFGFGGSLLAADTLAAAGGKAPALSRAFGVAMAATTAVAAVAGLALLAATPASQYESQVPVGALARAAALAVRDPAATVLGDDACGSAMLWLHPAMVGRVGFDARLEQYTLRQLAAYSDFLSVHGGSWRRVMAPYGVVAVSRVLHPRLAAALSRTAGWSVVYQTHGGLVAQRR